MIVGIKRAAVLLLEEDRHDEEVRQTFLAEDGQLDDLFAGRTRRKAEPPTRIAAVTPRENSLTETLPRVALLPPEGLTDAQKGRSIANALIQDLTIGLCASRSMSVVAPYTSEKIRAAKDRSSLLQQYNVIYALDTKKTDDWLLAQLIFMPKDEVVWATRFKLDPGGATRQLHSREANCEAIEVDGSSLIARYETGKCLTRAKGRSMQLGYM